MVQQVLCSRRLLRRGLEFHVCTINKSAHSKKMSGNLFNDPRISTYNYPSKTHTHIYIHTHTHLIICTNAPKDPQYLPHTYKQRKEIVSLSSKWREALILFWFTEISLLKCENKLCIDNTVFYVNICVAIWTAADMAQFDVCECVSDIGWSNRKLIADTVKICMSDVFTRQEKLSWTLLLCFPCVLWLLENEH